MVLSCNVLISSLKTSLFSLGTSVAKMSWVREAGISEGGWLKKSWGFVDAVAKKSAEESNDEGWANASQAKTFGGGLCTSSLGSSGSAWGTAENIKISTI